jgi:Holliday junction DNA helicase RuvA
LIGYLKGKILQKNQKYFLLDVNNVGYKVFGSNSLLPELEIGKEVALYIYTNVKEDDIALYGFREEKEQNLFEKLISISGIGPKVALDILGSPLYIIQNAILENDPKMLTQIKGIGKKTAERLILELKNKIDFTDFRMSEEKKDKVKIQIDEDIIGVLEGLGYEKYQIIKHFRKLPKKIKTTEDKIKWFLQNL